MEIDRLYVGDNIAVMSTLQAGTFDTCVTSPPYWWVRDYHLEGQHGLEETLAGYLRQMVAVFTQVRRLLKPSGTLFVNMGDTYNSYARGSYGAVPKTRSRYVHRPPQRFGGLKEKTLKPKDLMAQPWRLALALQEAGWYLRFEYIWRKTNGGREAHVKDRPPMSHEKIFMLSKRERRYYFNRDYAQEDGIWELPVDQSQWPNHPCPYPEAIVARCLVRGCPPGGLVLDPYVGSGTTAVVAKQLDRHYVGIDLGEEYVKHAEARIASETQLPLSIEEVG